MLQRNQKNLGWTEHGQGVPLQWATSVWGRRSRPNEPQRKSDTDTRVDPKTSPVPRLEGNPPAVRRAFLFYGKKARRAPVSCGTATLGCTRPPPSIDNPLTANPRKRRPPEGPILAQASPARASGQSRPRAGLAPRQGKRIAILHRRISERRS